MTGKDDLSGDLIKKFDERKEEIAKNEKYGELECEICDVKEIQNIEKGVSGFWLRAMLANVEIARTIQEKDRAILAYCNDIRLDLHEEGQGFTLTFDFEKNSYFKNESLTKKFIMSRQNVIEKCEGCQILWTANSDPTQMKKKKKKNVGGGKKKNITVTVKCDSFFNFFETIDMDEKEPSEDKEKDEEMEDEQDVGERMDVDYDLGQAFKDDIIPLALEYYLGVIEQEEEDLSDEDDENDDLDGEGDPSEDKKKPKKGKKGGAAGDQQECKQQ